MNTYTENDTVKSSSSNLQPDSEVSCLTCGTQVKLRLDVWKTFEAPAAVCRRCFETIPFPVFRQVFILQMQVAEMSKKVDQLFKVQEELEQLLNETEV